MSTVEVVNGRLPGLTHSVQYLAYQVGGFTSLESRASIACVPRTELAGLSFLLEGGNIKPAVKFASHKNWKPFMMLLPLRTANLPCYKHEFCP